MFLGKAKGYTDLKTERVTKASQKRARRAEREAIEKQKHNLLAILMNSNANPIKSRDMTGIICGYCPTLMNDYRSLKEHFSNTHRDLDFLMTKMQRFARNVVRLDVTDLRCEICLDDIDDLDTLLVHFKTEHEVDVFLDVDNVFLPFNFSGPSEELRCVICGVNFPLFKLMREHMNVHFKKFICNICGAGYVNVELLYRHKLRHKVTEVKCELCEKTFVTKARLHRHVETVHLKVKKNKCQFCDERFEEFNQKLLHMKKVHQMYMELNCTMCNRVFNTPRDYRLHVKNFHLMERTHVCMICGDAFFSLFLLKKHVVKHTGSRIFQCSYCSKSFARKATLREHIRIHENDRRFLCSFCPKAFVQKASLKAHLFSTHSNPLDL